MPFGAIVSLKAQKVERIWMLLCWIKHLLFLTKDKSLFTRLPALTTGLKIPGSDSWTWMNQSESHWTVSGVPHSNHSYPQLGLNRTIQHFKKRKKKTVRNWVRFCGQGNHTRGTRCAFPFFHPQLKALAWLSDLTQDEYGWWHLWYFWLFLNYGIVVLENHIGVLFSLKL